jgi:hypothetical protein
MSRPNPDEPDPLTCYFPPCSRLRTRAVHSSSLYCSEVCEIADAQINTLRAEVTRLRIQLNGTVR